MKKLSLILVFLIIFTNYSYSQFWKPKKPIENPIDLEQIEKPLVKSTPKPTPSSSLNEAKAIIQQLNSELNTAKLTNKELSEKLKTADTSLQQSEVRLAEVQKNADLIKEWGLEQEKQAFGWMEKFNKCLKRYHFLKNIVAVLAGLYGFILGLSLMKYVPPTYSAYAYALPFVGAILAFFAVWMFL